MADCIFCQIISKKIPSELIADAENFIVIKDINPKAPVHFLIIPKEHIISLEQTTEAHTVLLGSMLLYCQSLAKKLRLSARGYKVVINTGSEGGQLVPHLHFHFLGGKKLEFSV
jgi:histidine triad (HIT) family protein